MYMYRVYIRDFRVWTHSTGIILKTQKGSRNSLSLSLFSSRNINEATCLPWYEDACGHTRRCTCRAHAHKHTHTYAWCASKSSGELSLAQRYFVLKKKMEKENTCVRMKLENVEEGKVNRNNRDLLRSHIRTFFLKLILNSTLDV